MNSESKRRKLNTAPEDGGNPNNNPTVELPYISICRGCRDNQPNQLAHMGVGGCLYIDPDEEDLNWNYPFKEQDEPNKN